MFNKPPTRRLHAALKVAEKWIEAAYAEDGETGALCNLAEVKRDEIEEELSCVAFEKEVGDRERIYREAEPNISEGALRSAALSDGLLEAYCLLRDAPGDLFGSAPTARYWVMGALMVAKDAADAELARLKD